MKKSFCIIISILIIWILIGLWLFIFTRYAVYEWQVNNNVINIITTPRNNFNCENFKTWKTYKCSELNFFLNDNMIWVIWKGIFNIFLFIGIMLFVAKFYRVYKRDSKKLTNP